MVKLRKYFIPALVIFHVIGLALFMFFPDFVKLSYMNIGLCGLLVFLDRAVTAKGLIAALIVIAGGFTLELIGVHTGLLFGEYAYGSALGPKFMEIPLIIGVNWLAIVLASIGVIGSLKLKPGLAAVIAGSLSTAMDYLIEPVAIRFDFWSWTGTVIPVWNYICWFIFCTIFAYLCLKWWGSSNKTGAGLYVIWLIFFGILNFV
jgi:putative membrane protein